MLKQYIIILFAIIVLGIAFIFIEKRFSGFMTPNSTQPTTPTNTVSADTMQKFTSSDSRVTVSFPASWYVRDATQKGASGQFGPYVQTWTIASVVLKDGDNVIPENGVNIDFDIQSGGSNVPIESLLDCGNKTLTCERVGIDSEQFIKSTATLNTGIRTIDVATFYDQNVLRATAMIQTGSEQQVNEATAKKILESIKFSTK